MKQSADEFILSDMTFYKLTKDFELTKENLMECDIHKLIQDSAFPLTDGITGDNNYYSYNLDALVNKAQELKAEKITEYVLKHIE